jgi:DNA invertase Pin-like site-specific DNA recombinase
MAMQEAEGIKLCRRNGWQHQVFREVGKPAVEMRKLMKLVRAGKLDDVFVFRWDRLGRELRQVVALLNEFRRRGVRIVTADGCEQSIPTGTLFADLTGAFRRHHFSRRAEKRVRRRSQR